MGSCVLFDGGTVFKQKDRDWVTAEELYEVIRTVVEKEAARMGELQKPVWAVLAQQRMAGPTQEQGTVVFFKSGRSFGAIP